MVRFYFFIFVDVDNGNDGTKHVMDRYKKTTCDQSQNKLYTFVIGIPKN
jgi:hypothetical protein